LKQITNLLLLLIVTSLLLPATGIMYASNGIAFNGERQGSPENSDESADGGSTESSEESDSESMDDESDSESMDDESDSESMDDESDSGSMDDESDAWSMEKSNNALDSGSMDNNDDAMDGGPMDDAMDTMSMDDESDTWSMEKSNNALIPLATTPTGTNDALNPLSSGSTGTPTTVDGTTPTQTPTGGVTTEGPLGGETTQGPSPTPGTNAQQTFRIENTTGSATGNVTQADAEFINSILAVHNRERALVGVPPLVWNDTLAIGAKSWAEHLATTGLREHAPHVTENIAWGGTCYGYPGEPGYSCTPYTVIVLQEGWVHEKVNWNGSSSTCAPRHLCGHYTQMINGYSKQVGCGIASGPPSVTMGVLVCRYK
jgi:uncharacterized protein YkwD